MLAKLKSLWEIIGHIATAHALLQLAWPLGVAVITALLGYIGGQPLMWIAVAASMTFAAIAVGAFALSLYIQRKNPEHKLSIVQTIFTYDLIKNIPDRKQRRAIANHPSLAVPAPRHMEKGQLGIEVANTASFPMSLFVESAKTVADGKKPPRGDYPKASVIVAPGMRFWVTDDTIPFEGEECANITGLIDIVVKYGLPGKEKFILKHKGSVEIFMEPFGMLRTVYFHPDPT